MALIALGQLSKNWEISKLAALAKGGIEAAQSRTAAPVGGDIPAAGGRTVDVALASADGSRAMGSGLGGLPHPA